MTARQQRPSSEPYVKCSIPSAPRSTPDPSGAVYRLWLPVYIGILPSIYTNIGDLTNFGVVWYNGGATMCLGRGDTMAVKLYDTSIRIRLTKKQRQQFRDEAARREMTMSEIIRELIRQFARPAHSEEEQK